MTYLGWWLRRDGATVMLWRRRDGRVTWVRWEAFSGAMAPGTAGKASEAAIVRQRGGDCDGRGYGGRR